MRKISAAAAAAAAIALGIGGAGIAFGDVQPDAAPQSDIYIFEDAESGGTDLGGGLPDWSQSSDDEIGQSGETGENEDPDEGENEDPNEGENEEVEQIGGAITDITRVGCKVSITVETTGAADFTLDVYDDGDVDASFTWPMAKAGTHVVVWTITKPAKKEAPGVGFYLTSGEQNLDSVDPYEYPDSVASSCALEAQQSAGGTTDGAGQAAAAGQLAKTGVNGAQVALASGLTLLLVGSAALFASRRRVH